MSDTYKFTMVIIIFIIDDNYLCVIKKKNDERWDKILIKDHQCVKIKYIRIDKARRVAHGV